MTRHEVEARLDVMVGKARGVRYVSKRTGKLKQ